ncbi:glycosyltransferase family 4 protein [Neisseria sp. Ec49-e6-T10]|uniref:glycosyltransferase family 4 protein n=1 Tax=Neisseria sp. Ec49-e6-T10 TaxID=3140744 RepID=UPI003EBEC9C2
MIKVLHFCKTYYPNTFGGIEQVVYQLAEGGRLKGVEARVLSLSEQGKTQNIQVGHHDAYFSKTIVEFASTPLSFSVFQDLSKLVQQVDIIHYHFPWPFMDLAHFVCRIKKPSIVTYHSDIVKQKNLLRLYKPLMYKFFADVDSIVASSPNYMMTSQTLQRFKDKVTVVPFGLDKASYPQVAEQKKKEWQEKFGNRFFLFIGTFRYYKGLNILIEAAQGTSYPIVIVGAGPIEEKLKKQATDLGVQNVHFLGSLSDEDKVALLQLCGAVVFPSHLRSEAFGITLLEGAMYSKPMISCEIGTGTTYVNIADKTGLVIPPSNSVALREAMDTLWHNPMLAACLGENAGKRYDELFTSEKMVDQYIQLYQSILK